MLEDRVTPIRPRTDDLRANHFYDLDTSEPDPKRIRLTNGYDIALAVKEIPRTYQESLASPDAATWKKTIDREISSHSPNYTWDDVRRPHGARVIGSKWLFDVKRDAAGNVVRYKARLVAQGFRQVYGFDNWETYSLVASLNFCA